MTRADLLARAEAIRRRVTPAPADPTWWVLGQIGLGLWWIWQNTAWLRRAIRTMANRSWLGYRWLWRLAVHSHGGAFSRTRAGATLIVTLLIIWFAALPVAELVLWDGPIYLITARMNEIVYLRGSQEINPAVNSHAIKGCHTLPCDDAEAIYFRAENDLVSNVWSLIHGRGLFFPEYVAAAVPYETTRCVISSFGFRFRGTSRILNLFPQLLAVACDGGIMPRKL